MEDAVIVAQFDSIDRRLAAVERVMPTLATRQELRQAIADAVAPLATKQELREAIADAVAPLATKQELRDAVATLASKDDLAELRRHMEVLLEAQRDDIRLIAEHLSSVMSKRDDR